MLNYLNKMILLVTILLTLTFGHSVSDAFINVSKKANPAVVSILGTQDSQNNLKTDPLYEYFP